MPQPGQAPWPGAIRLGTSVIFQSGSSSTWSRPVARSRVTWAIPRETSAVVSSGRPGRGARSTLPGVAPW